VKITAARGEKKYVARFSRRRGGEQVRSMEIVTSNGHIGLDLMHR